MTQAIKRGLVAAGVLAAVGSANAAAVDVTAVTADIALQAAPIAAIGAAVLLIYVGVKAFQWVRKALS
ncbi:major capsid protein [Acidovorax sp. LjRoot74]|uniref:major capsid protein n=1 Tax=Acidovorax sp. LjRoot74 TaxID=3342337 RepID=UPI003ECE026C